MISATVLVTSAGGSAALNCIRALRAQNEAQIRLIAVDASPLSAGLYEADARYIVPCIDAPDYIRSILTIGIKEAADVILPTFSTEIPIFAAEALQFQHHSIKLLISPLSTVLMFSNKWSTYRFLKRHGFSTPETVLGGEAQPTLEYPLFLKPLIGSGSKGCYRVDSESDLSFYTKRFSTGFVLQRYLKGNEITVDLLTDSESRVVAAVPRLRVRIRDGMAVVGRTMENAELLEQVERFASLSGIVGPANIQGFLMKEKFVLTDINTRFSAGGLSLTIASGVNTPLMAVMLALGQSVSPARTYQTNLWMIGSQSQTFIRESKIDTVKQYESNLQL